MELEQLSKQIDDLAERVRRYMAVSEGAPSHALFVAGIQSALESMARSCHRHDDEMERMILVLGEMRALLGETSAGVRVMRNRMFCMAGEDHQKRAEKEVSENMESKSWDSLIKQEKQ